jgi:hypothetical protein
MKISCQRQGLEGKFPLPVGCDSLSLRVEGVPLAVEAEVIRHSRWNRPVNNKP